MPTRHGLAHPAERKSTRIKDLPQPSYTDDLPIAPPRTTTVQAAFDDDESELDDVSDDDDDGTTFRCAAKLPDSFVVKRKIGEFMSTLVFPLEVNLTIITTNSCV